MKELTLKEHQDLCLEILTEVDEFCTKNNIRYSLAHGTLIGAIRHHGFIPWDDDIDINMPRQDYDRFIRTFTSNSLRCFSFEKDQIYIAFARVCDMKRTISETKIPWNYVKCGVWIDVFPLDGVEESKLIRKVRLKLLGLLYKIQNVVRKSLYRIPKRVTFKKKIHHILKIIITSTINIKKLVGWEVFLCKRVEFGKTNLWGHLSVEAVEDKMVNNINDFSICRKIEFENHIFCIMNGAHNVLKNEYGDYMQLPPIEKRKPQQCFVKYYWK